MDLSTLEYFQLIASGATFEEAAGQFNISTSSISKAIRRMEEELGVELFDRSHRTARLNEAGGHFYRGIAPLISQYRILVNEVEGYKKARSLLVTSCPTFSGLGLAETVRTFELSHPENTLFLSNSRTISKCYTDLREGSIDVLLTSAPMPEYMDPNDFEIVELHKDPVVVAMAPHSPLTRFPALQPRDLEGYNIISDLIPLFSVPALAAKTGVKLKNQTTRLHTNDILTRVSVSDEISLFYLSELRFYRPSHALIRRLDGLEPHRVHLLWRKGRKPTPLMEEFCTCIVNACRDLSSTEFIDEWNRAVLQEE